MAGWDGHLQTMGVAVLGYHGSAGASCGRRIASCLRYDHERDASYRRVGARPVTPLKDEEEADTDGYDNQEFLFVRPVAPRRSGNGIPRGQRRLRKHSARFLGK